VTSSGDSGRIDDRVNKSDSGEIRAIIFAKQATKLKWNRSQVYYKLSEQKQTAWEAISVEFGAKK